MRSARKRKGLPLLAVLLALLCLTGCAVLKEKPINTYEGTWYFAKNAAECKISEGKIYQDDLHSKKGQTLIGVYREAEGCIEANLSGVGGVEVTRTLYVVQGDEGEVLCDSADGSGRVYFYRDALAAMAALEAAEVGTVANNSEDVPNRSVDPATEPVSDNSSPSDGPVDRSVPALEEDNPSPEPEPTFVTKSGDMVWIPQSGSKYHSDPTCSGMKNPTQVPRTEAKSRGFAPCKRCY